MRMLNPILAAMILAAASLAAAPAGASNYEFLAAPQINLSLVYRLDKTDRRNHRLPIWP